MQCVSPPPPSYCGCDHDGHYYLPGEEFWADSQCEQRCVCVAATQKVRCEQTKCQTGEACSIVDGVRDCYPISFKTCSARGDPHFTTFDGRKFDFQGNCVYKLAGVCGDTKGRNHFEVRTTLNSKTKVTSGNTPPVLDSFSVSVSVILTIKNTD
uniref:IgGFc-binding protein-like n=1 Tax=Seriola dumerili TaxID=41447 RepID=A0A3B4U575_SERDU